MPAWQILDARILPAGHRTNGILAAPPARDPKPFLLLNYPVRTNLVDGATIQCYAIQTGTTNLDGTTIPLSDFGIPDGTETFESLHRIFQRCEYVARPQEYSVHTKYKCEPFWLVAKFRIVVQSS
jgi:hypothetical protein